LLIKRPKDIITPLPEGIFVEITNICNFKCDFCPSSFSKRSPGFMQFDMFKKIVDEAKEAGVKYINLWLLGEPGLHPKILKFIQYAQNKDLWIAFITNGSLFLHKQELFKNLLNDFNKIVFNISYYGANEKTFSYTKAKQLNLKAYDNSVKWFIEENIKNGKNRLVNIVLLVNINKKESFKGPFDIEDMDDVIKKWNLYFGKLTEKYGLDKEAHFINKKILMQRLGKGPYDIEIIPRIKVEITIAHNWAKIFKPKGIKMVPRKYGYCHNPWTSFVISWNGDCTICCTDYDLVNNMGNIKENTLLEIWNSEKMQMVRTAMNKHKLILPFCRRCKALMIPKTINYSVINYIIKHYLRAMRLWSLQLINRPWSV